MSDVPSEDSWRLALKRYLEAGCTLSGQPHSSWPQPSMTALDLDGSPHAMRQRMRQPRGLPSEWLGARLSLHGQVDEERYAPHETPALARVAAYPVLPLVGQTFEVNSVSEIAPALRTLLGRVLPGVDWWVPEHWDGPFLKYGFMHNHLPAPPNDVNGEAMAIELFGQAERCVVVGSQEWVDVRAAASLGVEQPSAAVVQFPTRVKVQVATYANVCYPGVGVPFYM